MRKESILDRFVGKCIGIPVSQACDFIEQLQSDNSVLRTNVDGLEAKNVDLQAKVDGLEVKINRQQQRIKELEHNLSAKESQCDLYSQEIDANLKRIKELEAKNAEYLVDLMALKCVSSQMRCAYCNHEMIDANPGDGGVYIKKLVIEHMDKCEKHPLFEARKRIKELEAEVAGLKEHFREVVVTMNHAYTFVSSREKMHEDGQKLYMDCLTKIGELLSTPTGSKLLAKIEAGEKLVSIVKKVTCLAYAPCGEDHVELVVSANKALVAYRAACEGGGE